MCMQELLWSQCACVGHFMIFGLNKNRGWAVLFSWICIYCLKVKPVNSFLLLTKGNKVGRNWWTIINIETFAVEKHLVDRNPAANLFLESWRIQIYFLVLKQLKNS